MAAKTAIEINKPALSKKYPDAMWCLVKDTTIAAVRNAVATMAFGTMIDAVAYTPDGLVCIEIEPLSLNGNLLDVMALITPCVLSKKIEGAEVQKVRLHIEVSVAAIQPQV